MIFALVASLAQWCAATPLQRPTVHTLATPSSKHGETRTVPGRRADRLPPLPKRSTALTGNLQVTEDRSPGLPPPAADGRSPADASTMSYARLRLLEARCAACLLTTTGVRGHRAVQAVHHSVSRTPLTVSRPPLALAVPCASPQARDFTL